MFTLNRRTLLQGLMMGSLSHSAVHASESANLKRLVITVGFPPGGSPDLLGRYLADKLSRRNINTIVDNKVGASGRIAADAVITSKSAWPTVLLTPLEALTLFQALNPTKTPIQLEQLVPAMALTQSPFGIAVRGDSEVRNLAQLFDFYKRNPNEASYGTPGEGTAQHMVGLMLTKSAGVPAVHIPYKGGPLAIQDVIGGRLKAVIASYSALQAMHNDGLLRIIAHTGESEGELTAGVTSCENQGYRELKIQSTFSILAGKDITPSSMSELKAELSRVISSNNFKKDAAKFGQQPVKGGPDYINSILATDALFWSKAVSIYQAQK